MPQASAALSAQISACASINASLTPQVSIALPTLAVSAAVVADVAIPNLKAAISAGFKAPSVDVAGIDRATFDLSAKNPDGGEEITHRSPVEIMDEIAALDAESARVLESIKVLLA